MAKLDYRWRLREVMAARGLWATTDLAPLLRARDIDLSAAQVYRLVTQTPERLSLKTLMALCDALDCTTTDLIEPVEVATATASARRWERAVTARSVPCARSGPGSSPSGERRGAMLRPL